MEGERGRVKEERKKGWGKIGGEREVSHWDKAIPTNIAGSISR